MAGLLVGLVPAAASATWSIVAVDPDTREVGVAGATCNATVHERIPGLVPDVGALASQAASYNPNRQLALQLMRDGNTPQEILNAVAAQDGQWQTRQMGIADLTMASAAHTGTLNNDWAGDLQAPGISVQGNILRGADVVGDAMAVMTAAAPDCPYTLADRMMDAMEAARDQGGDSRCPENAPARSAFLWVAKPDDLENAPYIEITVPDTADDVDPVVLLREQYDAWREQNPPSDEGCGETGTGGGNGTGTGTGTGTGSSSSSGDGSTSGDGEGDGGGTGTGSSSGGTSSGSTSSSGSTGGPGSTGSSDDSDKKCGCTGAPGSHAAWVVVLIALSRRRPRS
jgi:uncharacterized Ntn-hydrolase superfamily protein